MTRDEFGVVVDWAIAEGWNPGATDANAFWAADPTGFFVGELDGEIVASISIVRSGDGRAFLGFYIVAPEQRGRGYGLALWQHARAAVVTKSTGLDGVVDQIANYERSGFVLAHRTIRFAGPAGGVPAASGVEVRPLEPTDLPSLLDYDLAVFGGDRAALLRPWVGRADARTIVAVEDDVVVGMGTMRPAVDGERIGPLFGDTREVAAAVLHALASAVDPQTVIAVDAPEVNAAAIDVARSCGMTPMFETARMHAGAPHPVDWSRVFGVTSLELG